MKNNAIRYKNRGGDKDEVGELLDGHFEENGIFRLPKICRWEDFFNNFIFLSLIWSQLFLTNLMLYLDAGWYYFMD